MRSNGKAIWSVLEGMLRGNGSSNVESLLSKAEPVKAGTKRGLFLEKVPKHKGPSKNLYLRLSLENMAKWIPICAQIVGHSSIQNQYCLLAKIKHNHFKTALVAYFILTLYYEAPINQRQKLSKFPIHFSPTKFCPVHSGHRRGCA